MHDDQHGTAVISTAAIINACDITGKNLKDLKIVVVGAGAAAISCARLYRYVGVENIFMLDSKGLIHKDRDNLNDQKREFMAESAMSKEEIFKGADVVVGLSRPGTFDIEDVKYMGESPIIFTLANPTPEIMPDLVREARPDAIIATGRSDFNNQVNNVLGFPFIFRGAMDVRAKKINTQMKIAAAKALAQLAKKEIPQELKEILQRDVEFGKDYIIPSPFDKRLIVEVSSAVAQAAVDSGSSSMKDFDIEAYRKELAEKI
jgi:malate dehydrogenase (oxaloacetate-decarboxylating)/malate dehydrogenase (oxaloacetate-decarboxylating)(NADP+)